MMGTAVEITVAQTDARTAQRAMAAAFRAVERVNFLMSRYRPESEVSRISRHAGEKEVPVSPETLEVIERALLISRLSSGAFDVTIGPVFRLWNFREGKIPEERVLRDTLLRVDYRQVRVDRAKSTVFLGRQGMELDLGGIAKGYASDAAAAALRRQGVQNFLVEAGGDLVSGGFRAKSLPWTIGIQHPRLADALLARIQPRNAGLATSGDYQKFFVSNGERYHHLLAPSTGLPAAESQSVTILGPSGMDADALATAVFVLGPEKGLALVQSFPDVHALIVDRRGIVRLSPNWPEGVLLPP